MYIHDNLKKIFFVAYKGVTGIREDGEFKYPPTYCEEQNIIKRRGITLKKQKLSCKKGETSLAEYDMNNFIKLLFLTGGGKVAKNTALSNDSTLNR